MKMKLAAYIALVKQYQAIADGVARAAAMKTLEGIQVVDENDQPVEVTLIDPNAPAADGGTVAVTPAAPDGSNTTTVTPPATPAAQPAANPPATPPAAQPAAPAAARTTTPAAGDPPAEPEDDEARIVRIVRTTLAATNPAAGRQPAPAARGIAVITSRSHAAAVNGNTGQNWVTPQGVKSVRVKNFKGIKNGQSPEERAYRFGMWALATISRQMPGRFSFKSAVEFVEGQKLHRENDNASGGYLVPPEFGQDLIDLREIYGVVRNAFKNVTMNSDIRRDPRRKSGLTAYFVGEARPGIESDKKWEQVELIAKKLMVLSRYTAELNADAVISIGDDLAAEIAYAFATKEDDCGFNGTGGANYGGITGIRPKLAGAAGSLIVASGATWNGITLNDFTALVGLLPQYADSPDAGWVCHKSFYAGVMQRLELAAGGNTVNEIQQGDRRPRPTFLGYPVNFSQIMPGKTAISDIPVILGDMSKAATFGDRQQEEIAFSEHASIGGENVFERNEIAIRGTERFDINVHDVGDATTPGPVVGLQTRAA